MVVIAHCHQHKISVFNAKQHSQAKSGAALVIGSKQSDACARMLVWMSE
jgi:hypothetical protein